MKVRLKKIILNKQSTKKMCSSQKLCKNKVCKELYKKSFASHPKAKYWSDIKIAEFLYYAKKKRPELKLEEIYKNLCKE